MLILMLMHATTMVEAIDIAVRWGIEWDHLLEHWLDHWLEHWWGHWLEHWLDHLCWTTVGPPCWTTVGPLVGGLLEHVCPLLALRWTTLRWTTTLDHHVGTMLDHPRWNLVGPPLDHPGCFPVQRRIVMMMVMQR